MVLGTEEPHEDEVMRQTLDDRFAFSNYWAMIMEEALEDMIQMPTRTWLCLVLELILLLGLFRAALDEFDYVLGLIVLYAVCVAAFVMLANATVMGRRNHILRSQKNGEELQEEHGIAGCLKKCGHFKLEVYFIWLWEVIRFSCIYIIIWNMFNFILGFEDYTVATTIIYLCIFLFLFLLLGLSTGVDMYVVLALPPFIDDGNMTVLLRVLAGTAKFQIDGEPRHPSVDFEETASSGHGVRKVAAKPSEQAPLMAELVGKPEIRRAEANADSSQDKTDLPGQLGQPSANDKMD